MKNNFLSGLQSIKAKMMITVLIGIVLFFTVIIINNNYSIRLIEERIDTIYENMTGLSGEYMDLRIKKSDNIAGEIANDSEVVILSSNYLVESDAYKSLNEVKTSVAGKMAYHSDSNEEIDSIYLYYKNRRSLIDSEKIIVKTNDPGVQEWVDSNTGWNAEIKWVDYYSELGGKSYISMMYRLDYLNQEIRSPVYLGINYDKNAIFDFLNKIKLTKNSSTALVNFNDNVFILNADSATVVDMKTKVKGKIGELETGKSVLVTLQELGKVFLRYSPLESGIGGIVHIIPEDDMLPFKKNLQPLIIAAAVVLSLIFLLVLYNLINSDIAKPTAKLIRHMKKLEAGRFSDKIDEKRKDEFGRVFNAYNSMTVEVEKLIQELYQEKLVKREMELKILQEKINPHFLYNTLDTINWIAKEHDVEEISKMVIALSTMYRKTFNKGRDLISIKDVMTSISCYLDIQQIRYGESFDYNIDCSPETRELEILNLIIQTLVENAIVHGMEGIKGKGIIEIKTKRQGEFLIVEVNDNGVGMSEEKLSLILASINSSGMESESGLRNVQKRIKLYYGSQFGIDIDSRKGNGTAVKVTIPAVRTLQ